MGIRQRNKSYLLERRWGFLDKSPELAESLNSNSDPDLGRLHTTVIAILAHYSTQKPHM